MKVLQFVCITLFISVCFSNYAFTQETIGVFVHGFNGSGDKWENISRSPIEFTNNNTIDDYVVFNYLAEELATDESRALMLSRFISQMDSKGNRSDDKWILIGHSLGGIVSRELYPAFRAFGFNIVAVISVGGPLQGAAATNVDTMYIRSEFNRLKEEFELASSNEHPLVSAYLLLDTIGNSFENLLSGNNTPSANSMLNRIPSMLEEARDSALSYSTYVLETNAKGLIGLDGSVIREINNYSAANINEHPQNYLSIIGAEKDQTPIRIAGYIFDSNENADEEQFLNDLEVFENDYLRENQRQWNMKGDRNALCAPFSSSCRSAKDRARRNESYWSTARSSINNLTATWATIINSYRFYDVNYQVYIPPCEDGNGMPGPMLNTIPTENDPYGCSQNPNGHYETFTSTVRVADKNDGVINTHSGLWSSNHEFDDDYNIYFDDVHIINGKDVGGWNHFELRHYRKTYDQPDGSGGFSFREGDLNPSMQAVEDWIDILFRN